MRRATRPAHREVEDKSAAVDKLAAADKPGRVAVAGADASTDAFAGDAEPDVCSSELVEHVECVLGECDRDPYASTVGVFKG